MERKFFFEEDLIMGNEDFIGVYESAFPLQLCEQLVDNFERLREANLVLTRQQHENMNKLFKDTQFAFHNVNVCSDSTPIELVRNELYTLANTFLWNHINQYYDKYSVLQAPYTAPMAIYTQKIQRTDVGGGYHVWHYEAPTRETSVRKLMYIVYLNDVEEGGETEFIYYAKRIKPKAGTLLIAPAGFTHTHRGNPPLSGVKYILNGWLEF